MTVRSYAAEDDVPRQLALAYDFLNTLDERRFVRYGRRHPGGDEIATRDEFAGWLSERGLLGGEGVEDRDLRLAHQLREGIRRVLRDRDKAAVDTAELADTLERLPVSLGVDRDGALRLQAARAGVNGVLTEIATSLATAVVDGSWKRLKTCAADDCRWVFYDHSRPRTGRWCTTSACGNRMKTFSYRQRLRSAPNTPVHADAQ